MRVENPDALKKWLILSLGPICSERLRRSDLAKYILTLVKNDKPEDELKKTCIEQLDIFLLKETEPFVEGLFNVLKDRSYLSNTGANQASTDTGYRQFFSQSTSAANETEGPAKTWSQEKSEKRKNLQASKESAREQSQNSRGSLRSVIGSSSGLMSRLRNGNSDSGGRKKLDDVTEEQSTHAKVTRQEKHTWDSLEDEDSSNTKKIRSDATSRSSNGIDQRSGYSGLKRSIDEASSSRSHLSSNSAYSPTYSAKRSRESREGGKSQKTQHLDYRNSYENVNVSQPSYDPGEISGPVLKNISPSATIQRRDIRRNEVKKQGRCHDYDASGRKVMRLSTYSSLCCFSGNFPESYHYGTDSTKRGFCVLGDECPFDHGNDPLVVEGAPLSGFDASVLQAAPTYNNYGNHAALATVPQTPLVMPRILPLPSTQQLPPFNPALLPPGIPTYDPKSPAMYREKDVYNGQNPAPYWPSHPLYPPMQEQPMMIHPLANEIPAYDPTRPPPPFHTHPKAYRPRELIGVPTTDCIHSTSQDEDRDRVVSSSSSPQKEVQPKEKIRVAPNKNMLTYCRPAPGCVLKVNSIPKHLNAVQHLSSHFQRFGKVESIVTNVENDPHAAVVYFSNPNEAAAACRFKGSVFGNKLIKVSWYQKSPEKPTCSQIASTSNATNEQRLPQTSTKTEAVTTPAKTEPVTTKAESKNFDLRNVINSRRSQKSFPRNVHQQLKERLDMMKKKQLLQKQKQEVLNQYIQNQKILLEKLSGCTNPAQIEAYKKVLRDMMEKTQNLQSDMRNEKTVPKKLPDSANNLSSEKKTEASGLALSENQLADGEVDSNIQENKEDAPEEISEEIKLNKVMFEDDDDEDSDDEDRSWRR